MRKYILPLIIFSFFCIQNLYGQNSVNKIKFVEKINEIEFNQGYRYGGFSGNESYLTWFEFYTGALFIYDFEKKGTKKIILKKGRGPGEYLSVSSISIGKDRIFLSDLLNAKVIAINISDFKREDKAFENILPLKICWTNRNLFLLNARGKIHFATYDFQNSNLKNIESDQDLFSQDKILTTFQREGTLVYHPKGYIFHLSRKYPLLIKINLKENVVESKNKFEDVEISDFREGKKTNNGNTIYSPPETGLENLDLVTLPYSTKKVLVILSGKGKNKEYKAKELYELNVGNEKLTKIYEFKYSAREMVRVGNFLFVHFPEENLIHKFKIS